MRCSSPAIRAAIQHPDHVRRMVVISSPHARSAWYPETQEGMSHVGASMAENMMQTPTSKFSKHWPEPQRFPQFLDKFGKMMSEDYDWSAEIAKLPMPVLLVFADNDSVAQKRITEFFECPRRCSRRFAGRVGAGADLGRVANES